jgi:hypothetical protein
MRLPIIVVILAILILFLMLGPVVQRQYAVRPVDSPLPAITQIGKLVTAGHGGIVISDAAGAEHSFPVFEEAHISMNGQLVPLENIPHGASVRVAVRRDGEVMAISSVDIPRPTWDVSHPLWPRDRW